MNNLPAPRKTEVTEVEARDTVLKAARGGEVPREDLREALKRVPDLASVAGDWAAQAEATVVRAVADAPVIEESLRALLEITRERLAQPGDGELERLLIRRVALASLVLDMAEKQRASKWSDGASQAEAAFWDRHVSRLLTDFLKACRGLAVVRKLSTPTLMAQVNVANQQQVNVGNSRPNE